MRRNLLANAVFHLPGGSEMAAGAEYQHEHGVSQVLYTLFGTPVPVAFDLRRATRSAFVELKWLATRDVVVRAGWRRDAVGGDAACASPSVGVRYDLPSLDASLKVSYSEGFKPPSFFALGLPAALGGNPDLRAEHSKGGSIGYEQKFWGGKGVASVALFKTLYKDLVTYDNEANRIVNAGHVDIRGAEFALSVPIGPSVRSALGFTRLLSHVADSDESLRQRPGRRGALDLTWSIDGIGMGRVASTELRGRRIVVRLGVVSGNELWLVDVNDRPACARFRSRLDAMSKMGVASAIKAYESRTR